jgi:hypothetical protein
MSDNEKGWRVGEAWRVGVGRVPGRFPGKWLYKDGECVGMVNTPELAAELVKAANRTANDLDPEQITFLEKLAKALPSFLAPLDLMRLWKIVRHLQSLEAFRTSVAEPYVHVRPKEEK